MAALEGLVRRLNPTARVERTVSSAVGLTEVLGTGEFDLEEASKAAGWLRVRALLAARDRWKYACRPLGLMDCHPPTLPSVDFRCMKHKLSRLCVFCVCHAC